MEEQQAVNATESAPVEQVVNQEPTTDQQVHETPAQTEQVQTPAPGYQGEPVDEYGVPWKNRAAEWKRKTEELAEALPNLVQDAVKSGFQQYGTPAKQEYTVEQLELYKLQNSDNPQILAWAEAEKSKLNRREIVREVEEKIQGQQRITQAEQTRQQSLNYVMQTYPDAFTKNAQGQIVSWNQNHPITGYIGRYMQEPELANNPRGLIAAAKMAYADYAMSQQSGNNLKQQQLKAEVKHLQKQTLVEGGGKQNIQVVPEHRVAIDKLKQSGSLKDAVAALSAINKAKRASQE
jgi:hypothetical protein